MRSFLFAALVSFLSVSILFGQQSVGVVSISNASSPVEFTVFKAVSTSFNLIEGKILVKAAINGELGNYLLDTGAESIILNRVPSAENSFEAIGIGGAAPAEEVLVQELNWEGLSFENLAAYKVDLRALESQMGLELDGIIGLNLLGQGALVLNLEKQVLEFRTSPNAREMRKDGWTAHTLGRAGHLLTVGMYLEGKKVNFGLDTGASLNIIGGEQHWNLANESVNLSGIHNNQSVAHRLTINQAKLKKEVIYTGPLYFTSCDVFTSQFDNQISGLLGFPFFENNEVVLDLKKGVMFLR